MNKKALLILAGLGVVAPLALLAAGMHGHGGFGPAGTGPGCGHGGFGAGLHGMHGMHGMAGDTPPPIAEMLDRHVGLDDKQKAAVDKLAGEMFATVKPIHEQLRSIHEDVQKALADNADAATVGNLVINAHRLKDQAKTAHDDFVAAVGKLLTAEQKAKFDDLVARMHRFHRFGPPDGPDGEE